jgi:hypothetical protein
MNSVANLEQFSIRFNAHLALGQQGIRCCPLGS